MFHTDLRPYVWMLCGSVSFTFMAILAHVLTRQCDWQMVATFRAGLVAVFAYGVARYYSAELVFWPWRLWVRSVSGSCSMLCTFFAFGALPAADVVTLTSTGPLWIALLAWPVYKMPPGWKVFGAILIGICGVALVEQPHLERGNIGVYFALGAAFLSAIAMLGLHSLSNLDPRAIVLHFSAVATVFCFTALVIGPRKYDPIGVLEPFILLKLIGMGVTALCGQLFLTLAFSHGTPAKVSVIGLTQIVFVLSFEVWLFGRELNPLMLVGTGLVITPTAWLLTRPRVVNPEREQRGELETDERTAANT